MATSYSYAGYNIYKSILSLKVYKNTINDKSDIKRVKNKIISEINNMIRMIYELKDILDTNPSSFNKDNLIRLEEDINNVAIVINELETHKEAIEMINILLEHEDDGFEVINKYDFRYYIYNLTNSSVGEDENLNSNDWNIILNNLMRLWARFKNNFYGDESYLTHTLPINKKTLYLSKTFLTSSFVVLVESAPYSLNTPKTSLHSSVSKQNIQVGFIESVGQVGQYSYFFPQA